MAVTENIIEEKVKLHLNNGTIDGVVQTIPINLGTISIQNFNAQKVVNIVPVLENCLTKEVYQVERIQKSKIVKGV